MGRNEQIKIYTTKEILEIAKKYEEEKIKNPVWGNWKLTKFKSLEYKDKEHWYEVDLERCKTSAEILDWIFQIFKKTWVTPQMIYDLCHALEDILNIQGNFCSGGIELNPNIDKLLKSLKITKMLRNVTLVTQM